MIETIKKKSMLVYNNYRCSVFLSIFKHNDQKSTTIHHKKMIYTFRNYYWYYFVERVIDMSFCNLGIWRHIYGKNKARNHCDQSCQRRHGNRYQHQRFKSTPSSLKKRSVLAQKFSSHR
jgi:hypothetical protein